METILEEDEEEDKDPQMAAKQDVDDLDTIAYNPEESEEEPFNTAIDDTSEDPTIVMDQSPPHSSQMMYTFLLRR